MLAAQRFIRYAEFSNYSTAEFSIKTDGAKMLQFLLLVCAAFLALMGAKGFSPSGIPITSSLSVKGTWGIVVGIVCILIGLTLLPAIWYGIDIYADWLKTP